MSFTLDLVCVLVSVLLTPIFTIVVKKVRPHVGYVVHYKKNMEKLEDGKKKLEDHMGKIVEKIEEAENQGLTVDPIVKEWEQTAENNKHQVEELMDAINESTSCLNLVSRYKMSKQSEQMLGILKGLIDNGNFDTFARPTQPRLEGQFTTRGDFVKYDSRTPVLEKIIGELRNPSVNTIGVYGMGGVGKTKVVEEVAKQVSGKGIFDEVVIVNVSHDVNVHKIQGVLADRIRVSLKSHTEKGRMNELYTRLNNGKNNLLILDDIWQELDLREIGIPLRDGDKGCKVIFTSRHFNVLEKMKVNLFVQVTELTEEESWDLFEKNVGITLVSAQHIAKLVCKECGGLPVAILAVGGALAGKDDKHVWNDVLDKLQDSMWESIDGIDRKMYASLRLSYDYLGEDGIVGKEAQSILLCCCLYPEDADIPVNFLVYHCVARKLLGQNKNRIEKARDRVLTLVGSLKTRSLLLDGENGDFVKMHDVVRDVVISIAKRNEDYLSIDAINEWPDYINENLVAVSVRFNDLKDVPHELICPQLHTLRIESRDSSFQFPDSFFNGVGKLMILELKGISMLSPPSSLANLSQLQTLILVDCQFKDMSFLKGLKSKLEVLVIESSDIKALPAELGELSHLRVLLLHESHKLKLIPAGVISKLTNLEELRFPDEFDFRGYNKSREVVEYASRATLSELSSLPRLTSLSVFIPNDTPVPVLHFDNLVSYRLAVGKKFEWDEQDSERTIVKLAYTTYNDVFATLLERAEKVYLYRVEGLKEGFLDKKDTGLFEVEHLVIKGSHDLDSLSSETSFSKLTKLDVNDCSFKFLFTKGLQQLRELKVKNCRLLEEIVGTEGEKVNLESLKALTLRNLPKLKSFGPKVENTTAKGDFLLQGQPLFSNKVIFPVLEQLEIRGLENITEIWDKHVNPTKSFPQLSRVDIKNCDKVVNVFPSYSCSWAQSLQKITVISCSGVQVVFSDSYHINFPKLRSVVLQNLEKLERFRGSSTRSVSLCLFDPQVIFPVLEQLEIGGLENITEIWDKHVDPTTSFPQLSGVDIENCDKVVNVFPSYSCSWAQSLQTIKVIRCRGVQVVFSITEEERERGGANNCSIKFPKLHHVELKDLEELERFCGNSNRSEPLCLFDPQVIFPVLEQLEIGGLENITEIWDKHVDPTTSFPQLSHVDIWSCNKVVNVFPSYFYSWAQSLQKIEVTICRGVQVVFSITEEEEERDGANNCSIIFPKLDSVTLKNLEKLHRFCGNSNKSECLFHPQLIFPVLEQLKIGGLENITEIWDKHVVPTTSFPQLSRVDIKNCNKVVNVFPSYSYSWAQSLQKIEVEKCRGVQVVFSITEEEEERDGANNCSIIFPKLDFVWLWNMEKLERFCGNSNRSECLFHPQVIFPVLKKLDIWNLENITEIWDKHVVPTSSFPQLSRVNIHDCDKLVNVFPSYSYSWAQSLEKIDVEKCRGVQVVFSITEEEEERDGANNCSIIFPKLDSVTLKYLEKLQRFCGNSTRSEPLYLFDPQVIFPVLEQLRIRGLENITEIWDKHVDPTTSFPQLSGVDIENCDKLVNVFPSYSYSWAQSLENIDVEKCRCVQVVFSITEEEEERDGANNCSIIFPKLDSVTLTYLEKLQRFCGNSTRSEPLYLFDPQVIFPVLEQLKIGGLENITEIWDKHVVPTTSFPQLSRVYIENCDKLVNVFPSYSYSWAQSLERIRVEKCRGVQVVFSITEEEEERDGANNCSIIFPKLDSVTLSYLEKLQRFCGNSTRSEPLYLFDPQVQFPALGGMFLGRLPGLETFREQVSARLKIVCNISQNPCRLVTAKAAIMYLQNTSDLGSKSK